MIGVELYCDDLERARAFYTEVLSLSVADEDKSRYAKFAAGPTFVCLERKGVESYPSRDKAVLFFAVPDLDAAIAAIGPERILLRERAWAVLHDPDGHNILLLQR